MLPKLILFLVIQVNAAHASVCCGGHAAIPSLITGFETTRLNAALSESRIIGDAPVQGLPVFRDHDDQSPSQRVRFSFATRLSERLQVGAGTMMGPSVGDTDALAAYEIYRRADPFGLEPQGLQFIQIMIPTGHSVYSTDVTDENEITGSGFYKLSLGQVWLTTWRKWDFFIAPKLTYSFTRTFPQPSGDRLTVTPGWGTNIHFGSGWAFHHLWRVGLGIEYSAQQEGRSVDANGARTSRAQFMWPVSLQLSHFYDLNSTITLAYQDETLLGPVQNTTLSRTASLLYSYRWGE